MVYSGCVCGGRTGIQRAGDIPGCRRDAPAGRRQQEAVDRGRGPLDGRAPLALRRHRPRPAAPPGGHPGAQRHGSVRSRSTFHSILCLQW